jgi:hypothetical protein
MNLTLLNDDILLFTFKNIKDISLTFFRAQEYYESQNANLYRKPFTVYDFLEASTDKNGYMEYFSIWSGYNIPGLIFDEWYNLHNYNDLTPREVELGHYIRSNTRFNQKYYIIAALEKDVRTIDHEIAHALWYLDDAYKANMEGLNGILKKEFPDNYKLIKKYLKKLGYNKEVIEDEIQAYLSTEPTSRLKDTNDFGLMCNKNFIALIQVYRLVLKKHLDILKSI